MATLEGCICHLHFAERNEHERFHSQAELILVVSGADPGLEPKAVSLMSTALPPASPAYLGSGLQYS